MGKLFDGENVQITVNCICETPPWCYMIISPPMKNNPPHKFSKKVYHLMEIFFFWKSTQYFRGHYVLDKPQQCFFNEFSNKDSCLFILHHQVKVSVRNSMCLLLECFPK